MKPDPRKMKLDDDMNIVEADGEKVAKTMDQSEIIMFHIKNEEHTVTVTEALSIMNEISGVLLAHGYCKSG